MFWLLAIFFGLLSISAWWLLRATFKSLEWPVPLDAASVLSDSGAQRPPITLRLTGNLPQKMYMSDSCPIILQGVSSQLANVDFELPRGVEVRMELLAAAFDVDGERQQQRPIPDLGNGVSFRWNISPKKSGQQKLSLTASWVDELKRVHDIASRTHEIKVSEFIGLSARHLKWFSVVAGVLTLIFSAIGAWASLQ